eukprot:TRINITY_DN4572_c0_g1_i4.p1 TRINITY_DN4572_c0_g1~~TRINITY_DN4572_c0_g1_i4.p1  ORF type:complete len:477 (-),score=105.33 TRINITY_DN4572_c0_g1_i4:105-1535(-)
MWRRSGGVVDGVSATVRASNAVSLWCGGRGVDHLVVGGVRGSSYASSAASTATPQSPKTAVVLLNMGGPPTQEEVLPFLTRLFSDNEIIQLPLSPAFQQRWIGPLIAKRRSPRIAQQYAAIGGGSPIFSWTEKQGNAMVKLLDSLSPATAPHKAYVAFRYAPPLTEDTLNEMKRDGVKRAVAFSQYPQWSCATTGSSLNELWRKVHALGMEDSIKWSVIDRWGTHPRFIEAVAKVVTDGLNKFPTPEDRKDAIILFSAHSLPAKIVNKGDPYTLEVGSTVNKVMELLGYSHRYMLSYQSQVGPAAWQGPATITTATALGRKGHRNVLVVPIAFTSDHIETLFELDIEVKHAANEAGVANYIRAPALNGEPLMFQAQAEIVNTHLHTFAAGAAAEAAGLVTTTTTTTQQQPQQQQQQQQQQQPESEEPTVAAALGCAEPHYSPQFPMRCPGCVNPACRNIVNPITPYTQPSLGLAAK